MRLPVSSVEAGRGAGMEGGPRRAAFLDRDGTIMREKEYISDPAQVELLPDAASALRLLAEAGYLLVVVTNQSGIARGYFTERDYRAVQGRLEALLAEEGVAVTGAYHCPHHPDFTGPCPCRKPGTALFERAAGELELDLAGSVYIGDRLRDVTPGLELGGRAILVRTGYGADLTDVPSGVEVARDLAEAAHRVVEG